MIAWFVQYCVEIRVNNKIARCIINCEFRQKLINLFIITYSYERIFLAVLSIIYYNFN